MSPRILSSLVVFCLIAGMLACITLSGGLWHSTSHTLASATSYLKSEDIQTKAKVFDFQDANGYTSIGIMGAYESNSRAFWWRPTPMIGDPKMLEAFYARCKFQMDGERLLNICVRGNEVVITSTSDYARSLEDGLAQAQAKLQANPGLSMGYRGPRDGGFNLQQKAGVDLNTPEGVPPTVVRSVQKLSNGWELDVTCGCGNARITLNNNFDFVGLRRN
jgi:hypothetical protein